MLVRDDLERIATTLTHGNVGHAETLYLQDIVLSTVSRETADQLVFKGGTALLKFHQLDRFSDDLDFTSRGPIDLQGVVESAVRDLENYGATVAEQTADESETSFSARLGIRGPLFTGERRSLCFLRVEVNTQASAIRVNNRRYTPQFPDVRTFELLVLDESEILAEKIHALVTRGQPRDLYDIYHLLGQSVRIEPELVQTKLEYYELAYDPERVLTAAKDIEPGWETLAPLTYSDLPPFDEVVDELDRALFARG